MSNEVSTIGGFSLDSLGELKKAAADHSEFAYIKFDKGDWLLGKEREEVDSKTTLWAVNPSSFKHGFQEWGDNKPGAKIMRALHEPVTKDELTLEFMQATDDDEIAEARKMGLIPVTEHRVSENREMRMVCTQGEMKNMTVAFQTSSTGGRSGVMELFHNIVRGIEKNPETPIPVIRLGSKSKTYNIPQKNGTLQTIHVKQPVFTIEFFDDIQATKSNQL